MRMNFPSSTGKPREVAIGHDPHNYIYASSNMSLRCIKSQRVRGKDTQFNECMEYWRTKKIKEIYIRLMSHVKEYNQLV